MSFIVTHTSWPFSDFFNRLLFSLSLSEHPNRTWPQGHFPGWNLHHGDLPENLRNNLEVQGSNFMWHKPWLMETEKGGSQEPPFSLLKCSSFLQPLLHEEWPCLMKNLSRWSSQRDNKHNNMSHCILAFLASLPFLPLFTTLSWHTPNKALTS